MAAQNSLNAAPVAATALSALGAWCADLVRAMQRARMMKVLSQMSDAELARIGVPRADIPAHAARMIGAA